MYLFNLLNFFFCCIFVFLYLYYLVGVKIIVVKKDGDYIINGGKMWIINGVQADWMCFLVNISEGLVYRNKLFICFLMNLLGMMLFVFM